MTNFLRKALTVASTFVISLSWTSPLPAQASPALLTGIPTLNHVSVEVTRSGDDATVTVSWSPSVNQTLNPSVVGANLADGEWNFNGFFVYHNSPTPLTASISSADPLTTASKYVPGFLPNTNPFNTPLVRTVSGAETRPVLNSVFCVQIQYKPSGSLLAFWVCSHNVDLTPTLATAPADEEEVPPAGSEEEVPPPVNFGGPLVAGSTLPHFTQGEEGTVTLRGKRMSRILSATINGVAVTVTGDLRSATITVPDTLPAGTYDLVLQTTNGRLTAMRFIKVS